MTWRARPRARPGGEWDARTAPGSVRWPRPWLRGADRARPGRGPRPRPEASRRAGRRRRSLVGAGEAAGLVARAHIDRWRGDGEVGLVERAVSRVDGDVRSLPGLLDPRAERDTELAG